MIGNSDGNGAPVLSRFAAIGCIDGASSPLKIIDPGAFSAPISAQGTGGLAEKEIILCLDRRLAISVFPVENKHKSLKKYLYMCRPVGDAEIPASATAAATNRVRRIKNHLDSVRSGARSAGVG
jgi:hypothetical protein